MQLSVEGQAVFAGTGGVAFDPARPAIVFLHGAGMDHSVWALLARYFAHRGRAVLAVDLPGHGRSGGAPLPSVEALADWLPALLDAAGLERAALAGHSLGSLVALETAARASRRVRALALLASAPLMPVNPALLEAARERVGEAIDLIADWAHGPVGQRGGNRAPGLWLIESARRLMARAGPGVLASDLVAADAYRGALDAAAKISCPTLVVIGAEDRMTPAKAGMKLAAAIPGARQATISACGHMMMLERPEETLAILRSAL